MRRTIIGRSAELELHARPRAEAREALLFDVRDHAGTVDQTLAERRVGSWTFAPWLMLTGHLILSLTMLMEGRSPAELGTVARVCLPILLAVLVDAAAGLLMLTWRRFQLAPHTIARLMCVYVGASGMLWTVGSASTGTLFAHDASLLTITMISGFFVRSTISVPSPPLAVVNALVA